MNDIASGALWADSIENPPLLPHSRVWTRVRIFYLLIVEAVILAAVVWLYYASYDSKFDEMRAKVRDITALLVINIDPGDVKLIHGPEDVDSPAFKRIHDYFEAAKARQPDLQYIDILRPPVPGGSGKWTFVVDLYPYDTDINGNGRIDKDEEGVLPGRVYEFANEANQDLYENALLGRETSSDHFVSDEWGVYISGFAPIHDKETGNNIGLLEVDISQRKFQQKMAQILVATTGVSILFMTMAAALLHLLFRSIESMRFIQAMSQDLYELATKDHLTQVTNRRHFYKLAEHAFQHAKRHGRAIYIMMLDADHFKKINDTYGHQAGDAALQSIAHLCGASLRTTDIIGRFGGEEFIVLISEMDPDKVLDVAERLRRRVEEAPIEVENASIRLTISIGAAHLESGDKDLDAVIHRADKALYEAKNRGRNCVVVS